MGTNAERSPEAAEATGNTLSYCGLLSPQWLESYGQCSWSDPASLQLLLEMKVLKRQENTSKMI